MLNLVFVRIYLFEISNILCISYSDSLGVGRNFLQS